MNTHRVTLTAFGTTGVLLAASLTMLAIVSALVTFDAWPTRDRGVSPAEIAVEHPHAARVVRAVRNASATAGLTGSGDVAGSLARGVRAAGLPDSPGGGGGGTADNPTNNPPSDPSPPPHVGQSPPGEDPNPGGGPEVISSDTGLVDQVSDTACGAVAAACGVVPDTSGGGSMDAPPPPVEVPALP
jgi:hypothetical protein